VFACSEFRKLLNVLGAATATARVFQAKLGFELAGHHNPVPSCFTDIRFSDSFAQTDIHTTPRR
jgi:hypothetical protein